MASVSSVSTRVGVLPAAEIMDLTSRRPQDIAGDVLRGEKVATALASPDLFDWERSLVCNRDSFQSVIYEQVKRYFRGRINAVNS